MLAKPKKSKAATLPLWGGPYDDGITFSLLCRFLVCRHRFWIRTVLGLVDEEAFNRSIEYGNLWHMAEEWHGRGKPWDVGLRKYRNKLLERYPDSEEEIEKWYAICKVQFAIYLDFLKRLPDVHKHKSIADERTFKMPYTLPSGRVIYLRGKFDRIFYVPSKSANIIYCQENKSKGFIDEEGILKTVGENLQTMLYQIALRSSFNPELGSFDFGTDTVLLPETPRRQYKIAGVLYNVIRRPLADNYAIKQKTGRTVIDKATGRSRKEGAETPAQFYARVGELIKADPMHYFKRWQVQITEPDLVTFRQHTFDPIMEQLCDWWDWIQVDPMDPWRPRTVGDLSGVELREAANTGNTLQRNIQNQIVDALATERVPSPHWQAPWGVYNGMYDGFRGDYFELLTSAGDITSPTKDHAEAYGPHSRSSSRAAIDPSMYGLQRATTLFPELT